MKPPLIVEMFNYLYTTINGIEYYAYYFYFPDKQRCIIMSKESFVALCQLNNWGVENITIGEDYTRITINIENNVKKQRKEARIIAPNTHNTNNISI